MPEKPLLFQPHLAATNPRHLQISDRGSLFGLNLLVRHQHTILCAMEESTNHFEYEPLNPLTNEIRLLILQPHSKTAPEAQIHCSIFNVPLNKFNRPRYEALSYVWGDASVTKPILLQGKPFKVTRALWIALRHLRLEDRPRTIWVDAICINQIDIAEREKQVGRMLDIYKNALRGLLWMDIPSESIQHILPLLERDYPEDEDQATDLALSLLNAVDVITLKELHILCAHPVWGRSWIVQELVLSPAVEVTTQQTSFNITRLQCLCMAANRYQFGGINRLPTEDRHKFSADANMPTSAFAYRTADPPVTSIIRAWQYFSLCKSSDPRDRIYALLSIASDNLGITPDYHITPKELFSKVARTSICQSKNLDVLCLGYLGNTPMWPAAEPQFGIQIAEDGSKICQTLEESLGMAKDAILPSWLPIFNLVGITSSSIAVLGLAAQYSAGQWSPDLEFDQVNSFTDPDILTLSGIRIDAVGSIKTSLYKVFPDLGTMLLRNFIDSMPTQPYPRTYFTGEDSFDAYWRTSIFDKSCTVGRLDRELTRSYRQIAASLIAVEFNLRRFDIKDHMFLESLEDEYPLFPTADVKYGMTLFKASLGRLVNYRFHITKSGYMAMIPRGAEEGDAICILLGSQVAHILRPVPGAQNPNTFTMIGIAYIHGFMDGEALEMCKKGELKESVFHLV